MHYFKSDNTAAVSREILEAISGANEGVALAYGADRWSERLDAVFGEFFGTKVRVFAVSSGTAANSLALATFCPSWGTVLTHAEAHIERDECGAPEFFTGGAKLSLVVVQAPRSCPTICARGWRGSSRTCTACSRACCRSHRRRSAARCTRRPEIRALADIARTHETCPVHMDGARFANALVAQNVVAGRADLEGGRRRAFIRRHQEWRHECRGRGVLRSGPRGGLRVPPQTRRAAGLQGPLRGRATNSPTSRRDCGDATRSSANRLAARIAAAAPQLLERAASRPTRCS